MLFLSILSSAYIFKLHYGFFTAIVQHNLQVQVYIIHFDWSIKFILLGLSLFQQQQLFAHFSPSAKGSSCLQYQRSPPEVYVLP